MDRHGMTKGRKIATGGNRSWSEEEENYLLQTRMQKMPYKHIAAHLKKTELACRLHYHQLSHGSHRRKRTGSTSTASSSSSSSKYSPTQFPLPGHDDGMNTPLHGSPNSYNSISPGSRYGLNTSPGRPQHKVLLPKPCNTMMPEDSPNRVHGLRINTAATMMHSAPVDTDRLHAIYNSHRSSFWEAIAAEYGSDVSPAQLEDIWRQGLNMGRRPPTPDDSPNGRITAHPMLKPSPFPNFTATASALDRPKEYSPIGHSAMSAPDRLPFPSMPSNSFGHGPLPGLGRSSSWSNASGVPATAITALLTENKCPRHAQYCGGHCSH